MPEQLTNPDAWLEVLGRAHVLLVHFPVGLLIVAATVEIFSALFSRRRVAAGDDSAPPPHHSPRPSGAVITMLAFGALGAALAAISGWTYAAWDLPDDTSDVLWWHRWLGVATAGVAVVALLGAVIARASSDHRSIGVFRLMLVLAAVLVGFAGHHGGTMVHGQNHVFAPLYQVSEPALPANPADPVEPTDVAAAPPRTDAGGQSTESGDVGGHGEPLIIFASQVQPIFESNCYRCHGPRRQRGQLRLDLPDLLAERITAGDLIVAGDPAASELVRRISLTPDDMDHMPPGDESLPPDEVEIISNWILQGASVVAIAGTSESSTDATTGSSTADNTIAPPRDDSTGVDAEGQNSESAGDGARGGEPDPFPTLTEAERATRDEAIARINEQGGASGGDARAGIIAANTDAVEVDLSALGAELTAEDLALLTGLEKSLVWLDCSKTSLDDDAARALLPFTQLRRLNLADTSITDAALDHLAQLHRLEVLNLNGTAITDTGILKLRPLVHLQRVYLWRSQVTITGAAGLRTTNPQVETVLGD